MCPNWDSTQHTGPNHACHSQWKILSPSVLRDRKHLLKETRAPWTQSQLARFLPESHELNAPGNNCDSFCLYGRVCESHNLRTALHLLASMWWWFQIAGIPPKACRKLGTPVPMSVSAPGVLVKGPAISRNVCGLVKLCSLMSPLCDQVGPKSDSITNQPMQSKFQFSLMQN